MEEAAWHARVARIDDAYSSVVINTALYDCAPDEARPHVYLLTIALLTPDAEGLASDQEALTLKPIETQITTDVCILGLVKAGSITGRKVRQVIFYGASSIDLQPVITQTTRKNRPYRFSLISKDDPDWGVYWSLYPAT